jgi:hypothetical protein
MVFCLFVILLLCCVASCSVVLCCGGGCGCVEGYKKESRVLEDQREKD